MKTAVLEYLLRLKFEYSSVVASKPRLALFYQPIVWWQQYKIFRYYRQHGATIKDCVVGEHTDFVLDGFQGSGNSFASAAFERSQQERVQMAHHMHAPAQIIKAVRMGLPTVVTIRPPVDAVASLISRWPYVTVEQALRGYVRFYEALVPHTEKLVVSTFEETTQQFGEVIREVNRRFGTSFDLFEHTEENMSALRNHKEVTSKEERQRQALKRRKKQEIVHEKHQKPLSRAREIHQRIASDR